MKKIFLLIASFMSLFLLGINNVMAEEDSTLIRIGEVELTAENPTSTDANGGTVTYDSATYTLTLNNYSYEGTGHLDYVDGSYKDYTGLYIDTYADEFKVVLKGNNTIRLLGESGVCDSNSIYCYLSAFVFVGKDFILSGDGVLNLSAENSKSGGIGLFVNGKNITFEGGATINIDNKNMNYFDGVNIDSYDFRNDDNFGKIIVVDANINVNIKTVYNEEMYTNNTAFYSDTSFVLDKGEINVNIAGSRSATGINTGDFILNGGSLKLNIDSHESSSGIYGDSKIIVNDGDLDVKVHSETVQTLECLDENTKSNDKMLGSYIVSNCASIVRAGDNDENTSLLYSTIGLSAENIDLFGGHIKVVNENDKNLYFTSSFNLGDFSKYTYKETISGSEETSAKSDANLLGNTLEVSFYTYELIEGDKQTVTKLSENYTLKIDGNPTKLSRVLIDDMEFNKGTDYTVEGEEIVFTAQGIEKITALTPEEHNFEVVYTLDSGEKSIKGTLTVGAEEAPVSEPEENPQTLDNIVVYGLIALGSLTGLATVLRKRIN